MSSKPTNCKLKPKEIRFIRRLYFKYASLANKYSVKSFARKFNVQETTIRAVLAGKTWTDV